MRSIKGLVIAAPASGSGKTTLTLGLLAALTRRKLKVAPFKIGPDFIDPGHHARITGRASRNLDGWMLSHRVNTEIFSSSCQSSHVAVVEGVMGLFDGVDGTSEAGSTAQMAKLLGLPVLLVVDASKMSRSFAALVKGFIEFDPGLNFCGIVANNIGSKRHLDYLRGSLSVVPGIKLLGGIPREIGLKIPSRHLGLVSAQDYVLNKETIDALAGLVENNIDLDGLVHSLPEIRVDYTPCRHIPEPDVRIGIAADKAFCFYYPDNLDLLRGSGCETVFFSPLEDDFLPENIQGLYLGGGYPELHADVLSENKNMLTQIQRACVSGMPVYAECGGFMYLCRELEDLEGKIHAMAGVFPFRTMMQTKRSSLGYRELRMLKQTPLGNEESVFRGHEFHYSSLRDNLSRDQVQQVYGATDKSGQHRSCPGWLKDNCLGSYAHLHFLSHPDSAGYFAAACRKYQEASMG